MTTKLKRAGYRSRYQLRKQTVEPVFGQVKPAKGFRQFLLRDIDKVEDEWALICTAHNLVKRARGRMNPHLPSTSAMPSLDGLLAMTEDFGSRLWEIRRTVLALTTWAAHRYGAWWGQHHA